MPTPGFPQLMKEQEGQVAESRPLTGAAILYSQQDESAWAKTLTPFFGTAIRTNHAASMGGHHRGAHRRRQHHLGLQKLDKERLQRLPALHQSYFLIANIQYQTKRIPK